MPERSLPRMRASYYNTVVERINGYLESGLWHGINQSDLDGWLENFRADDEKYFAACLLDSFIYRSNRQIESMYRYLFNVILPNYLFLNDRPIPISTVYFAPLATKIPGKSAETYFRILHNCVKIARQKRITISEEFLKKDPNVVILVDDFCGTGDSFADFYQAFDIKSYMNTHFFFCPLIAHENGITRIHKEFSNVKVVPVERLAKNSSIFLNSDIFEDELSARDFYLKFIGNLGFTDQELILGYGQQSLALAFEHSTPNETLPVFWSDKMTSPLVLRA